tara:strand:- start:2329 stop:2514 length:186 start_codon:yes stop_codon:yes gene_type:complete
MNNIKTEGYTFTLNPDTGVVVVYTDKDAMDPVYVGSNGNIIDQKSFEIEVAYILNELPACQ